jgi:hypothetical protein
LIFTASDFCFCKTSTHVNCNWNAGDSGDANQIEKNKIWISTEKLQRMVEEGGCGEVIKFFENNASSNGIAKMTEENSRRITALFPRGERDALPSDNSGFGYSIQLTKEELINGLLKLPKQRAAGMSGWTYELILQGCKPFLASRQSLEARNNWNPDDPGDSLLRKLLVFVNHMLQGRGGTAATWNRSKLIPLVKKNNEGIRPIAVDDSWIRVISRLASLKMATMVGEKLAPYQYAIGVPRGTEIIAHSAQNFSKIVQKEGSSKCIQKLDMSNAFNSISRRAIYDAIVKDFPQLLNWFYWEYSGTTDLVLPSGELAAQSTTGVRQGDPLGPLFFCLGIQRALIFVGTKFPNHEIMSYMDDITIMGDQEQMGEIVDMFSTQLGKVGLKLNPHKSQRMVNEAKLENQEQNFQGSLTCKGMEILGTYIGDEEGQSLYAREKIRLYSDILEWIQTIPINIGCPLIKSCVNSRPIYLARTMPTWTIKDSLEKFDNEIDQTLLALIGNGTIQFSRTSQIQRSKPMSKGGLGIMRISTIAEGAFTSSYLDAMVQIRQRSQQFSELFYEAAKSNLLTKNLQLISRITPLLIEQDVEGRNMLTLWKEGTDFGTDVEVPKQNQLSKIIVDKMEEELQLIMEGEGDGLGLAWIRSLKYAGSGSFLMPKTCLEIPINQYKAMLNMRLLSFPQPLTLNNHIGEHNIRGIQCTQCRNTTVQDANENGFGNFDVGEGGDVDLRFHSMNCNSTGATKINRHNLVVRELLTLFKSLKLNCGGEKQLQNSNHRLDATVVLSGESTFYIDVTIVNPACHTYVRSQRSDLYDLATAKFAECKKKDKYSPYFINQDPVIDMRKFVPFVIETSGKLGEEAEAFLLKVKSQGNQENVDFLFRRFKNNIWKIIARGNAMCYLEFHKNLRNVTLQRTLLGNN